MKRVLLVSVVIPTHNRCALLGRTLNALGAQTLTADGMEVLVVADGCDDETVSVLAQRQGDCFRLRALEQPAAGAAIARNRGAAHAKGQFLLFIDDDVEAEQHLVENHVARHCASNDPKQVVIGYSRPVFDERGGAYAALLRAWWEAHFQAMREPGHRFTFEDLLSGNVSLRSKLFAEVGGFDPAFGGAGREDYDFAVRLLDAGANFVFAEEALGYHHEQADVGRAFRRKYREGQSDVLLGWCHPALRPRLPFCDPQVRRAPSPLRRFAFAMPRMGDTLASCLAHGLGPLERLAARKAWRMLLWFLLDYWYWRGVAGKLQTRRPHPDPLPEGAGRKSPQPVATFLKDGNESVRTSIVPLELDLECGPPELERRIDKERPESVVLRYLGEEVGSIPARHGAERLRGEQLRPALTTQLAASFLSSIAVRQLAGGARRECVSTESGGTRRSLVTEHAHPDPAARIKVASLELSEGVRPITGLEQYVAVRVLVRHLGRPLGWVQINEPNAASVSAGRLRACVAQQLGPALVRAVLREALALQPPDGAHSAHRDPPVSIVVCTRDRPQQLGRCLEALLGLEYPTDAREIVVVDNASADNRTADLVAGLPVRYVRENHPGLNWARNRGIASAHFDLIAFTDDDAQPDRGWLRAIADAFAETSVAAVTGLVAPLELDTQAQVQFELGYGGMGHGFSWNAFRWNAETLPWQLLWASGFGVGANMAFRREVLNAVGQFDVALDVGTPSNGGGDVEMFHRLVASGYTLVYDPSALVWHMHRREWSSLQRLVFANGQSFGAYLLTCARNRTVSRSAILWFALSGWLGGWLLPQAWRSGPSGFPRRDLALLELLGALTSPFAYCAAQARARQLRRKAC